MYFLNENAERIFLVLNMKIYKKQIIMENNHLKLENGIL